MPWLPSIAISLSFSPNCTLEKYRIDPLSVCFYNDEVLLKFAGFFRPDHDPPFTRRASYYLLRNQFRAPFRDIAKRVALL
jgi:hypothetical protein